MSMTRREAIESFLGMGQAIEGEWGRKTAAVEEATEALLALGVAPEEIEAAS